MTNSCFWVATHFIGNEESIRKIIGNKWLEKKSVSVKLLIDTTHITNIDKSIIQLFTQKGEVRFLKGLHAKIYIFDDKCIITSANLSEKAFSKRYEIGVLLEGAEVKEIKDIFQQWWSMGESIYRNSISETNAKFTSSESSQLPILWNLPCDPGE
jgi:phosphatidylserine/phosphatidylglycerophosphate/cardiolipin synthase-like enzyme